jgi:aspartate beta-hydroxylase
MQGERYDRVSVLSRRASEATGRGQFEEAASLWNQVIVLAPDHPRALLFLGQQSLHGGDSGSAQPFLERAASIAPDDATIWLNLSFVFRARGEMKAEMSAIQRALEADPYNFLALLGKAMLLERQQRSRLAARAFADALSVMPNEERLTSSVRAAVARARECIHRNAGELDAFLQASLGEIRARYPSQRLTRFDECLGIASGTKKLYLNQMTGLHFPQLPAIGFHDETHFEWLERLAAASDVIRDELVGLRGRSADEFSAYVRHPPGVPLNQWSELNFSPRWNAYFLWQDGVRDDAHCEQCPRTAALLEALPMARIPGFAPTAFFSVLAPHTRIPAHMGVTNVRLITHLPLVTPPACGFRVGNEIRQWEAGRPFVFDDAIEHEAWNDSDQTRVVLIFDVWNIGLSAAERELVCGLLKNMRAYYSE